MRYYNNSHDGLIGAGTPKIVQALMVYVYPDRIELKMKNFGERNGGEQELAPYVVPRENAQKPVTAEVIALDPRAFDILLKKRDF